MRIAYRMWGHPEAETVVLVPGAGAHAGWWSEMADRLRSDFRIVAIEFSGSGESGHREEYSGGVWAMELIALIEHEAGGRASIIGHSNGGRVAMIAASQRPDAVAGVLMIDSPTRRPPSGGPDPRNRFDPGPPRVHASLEQAIASFRLQPHEPVANREFMLEVAAESFGAVGGGWALKADHRSYGVLREREFAEAMETSEVPATLVYGDQSVVVAREDVDDFLEAHPGPHEAVAIRGGRHHLLFDYGAELAVLIRGFLAAHPAQ